MKTLTGIHGYFKVVIRTHYAPGLPTKGGAMLKMVFTAVFLLINFYCVSQSIKRFDLVIDEIFADPSPQQGLPDAEFIELKNISGETVSLLNWRISNGKTEGMIRTDYQLLPDSFVVVCSQTAAALYQPYCSSVSLSPYPGLDNNKGSISIFAPDGNLVHQVSYDQSWYDNPVKSGGGWSLEMIDPLNPCSGRNNWKAAVDKKGGSPGVRNSIDGPNPDKHPPALVRTYPADSLTVIAVFDESLDISSAEFAGNYIISPGIGHPVRAKVNGQSLNEVILILAVPLSEHNVYELEATGIADCSGLETSLRRKVQLGFPVIAQPFDVVINEALFNPAKDGEDYIEIYNRSSRPIDLQQLYLASRNALGDISGVKEIKESSYLFFPGDYIALTPDIRSLSDNFHIRDPATIIELSPFPSFPDKVGNILIMTSAGITVDELAYHEKWHFPLISDPEGVALERINYNAPTQDKNNWTSASSISGYGTPGYANSQQRADLSVQGVLQVNPKSFSPDNDGVDDFGWLRYQMAGPGYMASAVVYDATGIRVRYLLRNALLGVKGEIAWDGLSDESLALPSGIYIILTEIFDLTGKTKKFKNAIILKRRLK